MGFIVDLIIIGIIVLSTFLAYKKGLVAQAIKLCAVIIAILVTLILYKPISNLIINTTSLDETIQNAIYESAFQAAKEENQGELNEQGIIEGVVLTKVQETSRDISIKIINVGVMLILFYGTKFALKFVTAIADKVAKLPILNKINKAGGIVYGLIRGFVIVYGCLLLISFAGKIDNKSFVHKSVEESTIGKLMYENNVFNILL